jgi:hypothetical protein
VLDKVLPSSVAEDEGKQHHVEVRD